MRRWLVTLALVPALVQHALAQVAGVHTDLPRWCGKPSPNYNPGGQTEPPPAQASTLLYVLVEPRYSIYVGRENTGTFLVSAALSHSFGQSFQSSQHQGGPHNGGYGGHHGRSDQLDFQIKVQNTGQTLVSSRVAINTTNNLFDFDLGKLTPQMEAYNIVLTATYSQGQSYSATTKLYFLPDKTSGSITKVDNLYGGLLFSNNVTKHQFVPWLPYGGYADYSGWFDLSLQNIQSYYDEGFNTVHPVTDLYGNYTVILDYMDQINLLWQFEMRGIFMNLTAVAERVPLVKDHTSFLAYYTADEPDGWEYALNSTTLAYDTIAAIDKYHPVSLVLNCNNFYFEQYSAGADIIMEDAYPIGINATYSRPWGTVCNETYGDCGCDDCVASIEAVPNVLDAYTTYASWLGEQTSKPLWAVPQGFDGEGYWARLPSTQEAWAMSILGFNHRAKGVMIWIFPLEDYLTAAHSQLAKVVTVQPVLGFLTGAQPTAVQVPGMSSLDVAYWTVGNQVLVSVVNTAYNSTVGSVDIELPIRAGRVAEQPWGNASWTLQGNRLCANGLDALASSMVILDLEGWW